MKISMEFTAGEFLNAIERGQLQPLLKAIDTAETTAKTVS